MKSLGSVSLLVLVSATGFLAANCSSHSSRSIDADDAESGGTAGASGNPKDNVDAGSGNGGNKASEEPGHGGSGSETGGATSTGGSGESSGGENASGGAPSGGAASGGASAGTAGMDSTSGGAAGAGGAVISVCTTDGECGAGRFCNKPADVACNAAATGECTAYGTGYSPVCGCDGVTYGNAKLIVGSPVKIRGAGECSTTDAAHCTTTANCARGKCVTIVASSDACSLRIANQGKCWDIGNTPEDCTGSGGFYRNCADPNAGCLNACTLAQQGIKAYPAAIKSCLAIHPGTDLPVEKL